MLLGESDDPRHLIPLGDPSVSRVVVGRSVPFDRTRIKEVSRVLQTGSFHDDHARFGERDSVASASGKDEVSEYEALRASLLVFWARNLYYSCRFCLLM